ncbi:GNAT family N-acetyltransferase [Nocardioides kongjuensis]|uniref:Putative GNAT superfamily acetyltransferase n=1 Tax=Nocardioides kongjuensis TaxID=349522 RepID=A0A852RKQ3_9ACTN|nr:putative GNAT superfamily acetyltransferase [Nocardioides kongjuensis]
MAGHDLSSRTSCLQTTTPVGTRWTIVVVSDYLASPIAAEPPPAVLRHDAVAEAAAAAADAGVELRELRDLVDLEQVAQLYIDIWKGTPGTAPVSVEMLRALSAAESYVVGAYDGPALLGACVAFAGPPESRLLHSHIAGVAAAAQQRGVGYAIKLHQRAWALHHGMETIAWTFDPLIRRNAHFNLTKLGARPVRYHVNFYGALDDGINREDATDRLYLHWELTVPRTAAGEFRDAAAVLVSGPDDRPRTTLAPQAARITVGLPGDVERLRDADPEAGRQWRLAVRALLCAELEAGARIVGFDQARGYLLERASG